MISVVDIFELLEVIETLDRRRMSHHEQQLLIKYLKEFARLTANHNADRKAPKEVQSWDETPQRPDFGFR